MLQILQIQRNETLGSCTKILSSQTGDFAQHSTPMITGEGSALLRLLWPELSPSFGWMGKGRKPGVVVVVFLCPLLASFFVASSLTCYLLLTPQTPSPLVVDAGPRPHTSTRVVSLTPYTLGERGREGGKGPACLPCPESLLGVIRETLHSYLRV